MTSSFLASQLRHTCRWGFRSLVVTSYHIPVTRYWYYLYMFIWWFCNSSLQNPMHHYIIGNILLMIIRPTTTIVWEFRDLSLSILSLIPIIPAPFNLGSNANFISTAAVSRVASLGGSVQTKTVQCFLFHLLQNACVPLILFSSFISYFPKPQQVTLQFVVKRIIKPKANFFKSQYSY